MKAVTLQSQILYIKQKNKATKEMAKITKMLK